LAAPANAKETAETSSKMRGIIVILLILAISLNSVHSIYVVDDRKVRSDAEKFLIGTGLLGWEG